MQVSRSFKRLEEFKVNFADAFRVVISHEGGYVNDSKDPGGETKFGISKAAYPNEDIKNLNLDRARELYHRDYWVAADCEKLPDTIRLAMFDCAVNQGVGTAKRLLQRSLKLQEDGVIGMVTLAAAQRKASKSLLVDFLAERLEHYAALPKLAKFWPGWFRRLFYIALEGK